MKFVFQSGKSFSHDSVQVSIAPQKNNEIQRMPDGRRNLIVGIEDLNKINHRQYLLICRKIVSIAKQNRIKKLAIDLTSLDFPNVKLSLEKKFERLAAEFEMANYEFNKYKTKPKEGWNEVEEVVVTGDYGDEVKESFIKGQLIGQWTNISRDLANTPGSEMTPETLALKVNSLAKGSRVKVTVLNDKKIQVLKMGGLLAVGQGSHEKPRFIIMEYNGEGKNNKPIVIVGKAVTFDTGGINLKPNDGLKDMHMDMAGGAAVIAGLFLADKMNVKKNLVALIPVAENKPSGSSFRPGDIITMLSGTTVEVNNTDAEGRLIVADALTYAKKYNPRLVLDLATLTGAAWVALGNRASALFTRDEKLVDTFRQAGESSGDYLWPLPLWDEYESEIKGTFADLDNVGKFQRVGGAITAAMFLYQFAKGYPWVHIDIAPRMVTFEGEYLSKGAYGTGVRLLADLFERL